VAEDIHAGMEGQTKCYEMMGIAYLGWDWKIALSYTWRSLFRRKNMVERGIFNIPRECKQICSIAVMF